MKTPQGNYITQGLFLELQYDESAIYTLKDEDYEYKDKLYPSIKRLYLEMEDVVEYDFATTYFCGWDHWQRICANRLLTSKIQTWRDELDLKLRSRAFKQILQRTQTEQGMVANKWIADKGWIKTGAGRPSKETLAQEKSYREAALNEYSADVVRIGRLGD